MDLTVHDVGMKQLNYSWVELHLFKLVFFLTNFFTLYQETRLKKITVNGRNLLSIFKYSAYDIMQTT